MKEFIQINITEILESVLYSFNVINLVYHNYCKLRKSGKKMCVDFSAYNSLYRKLMEYTHITDTIILVLL